jgi:hypothetical protein
MRPDSGATGEDVIFKNSPPKDIHQRRSVPFFVGRLANTSAQKPIASM